MNGTGNTPAVHPTGRPAKLPGGRVDVVAPAQQSESFDVMGRAGILPEAERTLALLMALGRGGSAMVVGIARIAPDPFLQLGPGASSLKKPGDRGRHDSIREELAKGVRRF